MTFKCSPLVLGKCCSPTNGDTHPFCVVTSAGHQEWGWISATQPLLFMILIKLVSNVLGTVGAG